MSLRRRFPCIRRMVIAAGVVAMGLMASPRSADAVILEKSAIRNKSAPTGAEANSGWQYEGHWDNGFEGTPIAPHYFITASHIGGGVGGAIFFRGVNYTTTAQYDDPNTDLKIYKINGTFPAYAQLYSKTDETGKLATVFGRGTGRGDAVTVDGQTKGWLWAAQDKVDSWGDNTVSAIKNFGSGYGDLLDFTFNRTGGTANEAALSTGDSGGGVFIKDGTTWKLAGINYLVDGPFSKTAGGPTFMASIYDKGGLYVSNSPITDTATDVPGNWYATDISRRLTWIKSVIGSTPSAAPLSLTGATNVAAVPEPMSVSLLMVPTLMIWGRRRRARVVA